MDDLVMMQSPGAWPQNLILPLKNPSKPQASSWPTYGVLRYHPGPDEFSFYEGLAIHEVHAILAATPTQVFKANELSTLTDGGWLVN